MQLKLCIRHKDGLRRVYGNPKRLIDVGSRSLDSVYPTAEFPKPAIYYPTVIGLLQPRIG